MKNIKGLKGLVILDSNQQKLIKGGNGIDSIDGGFGGGSPCSQQCSPPGCLCVIQGAGCCNSCQPFGSDPRLGACS